MKKIFLLADDDVDDVELFQEALKEADPSIVLYHAKDGHTALTKLTDEELHEPGIIFLDINMPGMNGWECLTIIKKSDVHKNIPVIIYSTSAHKREMEKAFELGASFFFTKPYDFTDLKNNLKVIADNLEGNLVDAVSELKGIRYNKQMQ